MKNSLLSLMLAISTVLVFPFQSYAQDNLDDDGEEIVIGDETLNSNGHGRTIVTVPICAMLFRSVSCIEVEFYRDLGDVVISLTNLVTGDNSTIMVNSQSGSIMIPYAPINGLWRITFQLTENDSSYSGTFFI